MNKTSFYTVWAGIYILCAGLSFIPEPAGFLKFLMIALSLAFFIPPAWLLYRAKQEGDNFTVKLVRNLSLVSLALTVLVLIVNLLTFMAPEAVGNFLYVLLVLVSTPMICSGYWVASLFAWACLLMATFLKPKKQTTPC